MAFDFSKIKVRSESDWSEYWKEQEVEQTLAELEKRASRSFDRSKVTLSEDPEIRMTREGDEIAFFRGTRSDGTVFRGTLKSFPYEKDFHKRICQLAKGAEIDVEFHDETRSWKDQQNNWRSTVEQVIDVTHGPAALVFTPPNGMEMPKSRFQMVQEARQRSAEAATGIGL